MTDIMEIKVYPDNVLRHITTEIDEIDEETDRLIDSMAATMYEAKGVGLAAPQVGSNLRLAVVDTSGREGSKNLIVLVNPKIIHCEGTIMSEEGCLSFPTMYIEIPRSEKVIVEALDRRGDKWNLEAEGFDAIAFQHEIDHLEGRLIIDYLSKIKREMALKNWRAALAKKQNSND